jgi:ribosomal protein S18 acetylase RimI-like enzyme
MLKLSRVTRDDFEVYIQRIIKFYANESILAGRWLEKDSMDNSVKAINEILPQKEKTENQYLYNIFSNEINIGYLWYGYIENDEAYLMALEIDKEYQGKGFGEEALELMEQQIKRDNKKKIRLHVYNISEKAVKLYSKNGYKTMSMIMLKEI